MNSNIVILYEFKPSSLPKVEVSLGEDIYQAFVVCVYLTSLSNQVMPPGLQGMNYSDQFQIMGRVVELIGLKLSRSVRNYFALLHEDCSQSSP